MKWLSIVGRLLPAVFWLAGQIASATRRSSEAGRKISPDELAELITGFWERLDPVLRDSLQGHVDDEDP